MSDFFAAVAHAWTLIFGWMPTPIDIFATVLIGLIVVVLLIKIVAFILDAIPFL